MKEDIDDGLHARAESAAREAGVPLDVWLSRAIKDQLGNDAPAGDEPTRALSLAQRLKGRAASMRDRIGAALSKAPDPAERLAPPGQSSAGPSLLDRLTPHRRIVLASVVAALLVGGLLWFALDAVDPLPDKPAPVAANDAGKTPPKPAAIPQPNPAPQPAAPPAPLQLPPTAQPPAPPPAGTQPPSPPASVVRQMDTQPLAAVRQYAEAGVPSAQMELGRRYYRGIGVEKSDAEAAKWIERAAEQGDANAEFNVGVLYEQGLGVIRDVPRAMEWYKKAAAHGMPLAMHNMAMALHRGEGVPRNLPEVRRLLTEAAELGLIQSQFSLALVFEQGVGGPVDKVRALAWMALAARSNDPQIIERFQKMSAAALPSDVEQGQNLAVQLAARIVENRRRQEAQKQIDNPVPTAQPAPPPGNMPTLSTAQPPPPGQRNATAPGAKPADRATITEAQRLLTSLKLYSGPINGVLGPQTEKALREFQAMSDLPENGAVTPETIAALREIAAAAGQPKRR